MLRAYLDKEYYSSKDWQEPLLFNAQYSNDMTYNKIDITQFISSDYPNDIVHRIYFNNVTYSVMEEYKIIFECDYASLSSNQFFSICFKVLLSINYHLIYVMQLNENGFSLKRNSVYGKKSPKEFQISERFSCNGFRIYKPSTNILLKDKIRKYTYHHDRTNQQKDGRKLCRRIHNKLLMNKCQRCNYFLRIYFDTNFFYVVPDQGNKSHQHHKKICSDTICNIDKINYQLMKDIG